MAAWLDGNRQRSVLHELSASIQLGRTHAVAYQRPVTLCPSTDGRHCGSDWGEGWLLAEDGGERLLVGRALAKKERLRWNRSNRLRFLPSGQLNIHNGRFLLCGRHTVAWQRSSTGRAGSVPRAPGRTGRNVSYAALPDDHGPVVLPTGRPSTTAKTLPGRLACFPGVDPWSNRMSYRSNSTGFTLIELLIIVVLLAIMASFAIRTSSS